jgi:uncharacterized membrane protein YedE/YeeE
LSSSKGQSYFFLINLLQTSICLQLVTSCIVVTLFELKSIFQGTYSMSPSEITVLGGLLIGLVYGVAAQVTGFCLNRALRDRFNVGEGSKVYNVPEQPKKSLNASERSGKLRSFVLALAVAMAGTQWAHERGMIQLSQSIYVTNQFSWLLLPAGGLLFGWGMILARGCGARSLVLLGQGNMRSLVVALCLGISAFVTLTGLLGPLRGAVATVTTVSLPSASLQHRWGVAFVVLGLLFYVFKDRGFVKQHRNVLGGFIIGLLIVAGWLVTGWLGFDEFETNAPGAVGSLTFVAPIGMTIQYAMIATGLSLNFGVTVVVGVVVGAFVSARVTRTNKFEGFRSAEEIRRYIAGGVFMGVGGALAMGCSIGQGLTGLSTLSYVSMLAASGIVLGARWALHRGY